MTKKSPTFTKIANFEKEGDKKSEEKQRGWKSRRMNVQRGRRSYTVGRHTKNKKEVSLTNLQNDIEFHR